MASAGDMAFDALADPTRRAILRVLGDRGECAAGEIASEIDTVGRTAVSSQLRVLRTAGLVSERRQGRQRIYTLQPGAADAVVEFLTELYRTSLSDLKKKVETPRKTKPNGRARPG